MRIFCPAMASLRSLSVGRQGPVTGLNRRSAPICRIGTVCGPLGPPQRLEPSRCRAYVRDLAVLGYCCSWDATEPPTPEVGRVAYPAQYRLCNFPAAGFLSSAVVR